MAQEGAEGDEAQASQLPHVAGSPGVAPGSAAAAAAAAATAAAAALLEPVAPGLPWTATEDQVRRLLPSVLSSGLRDSWESLCRAWLPLVHPGLTRRYTRCVPQSVCSAILGVYITVGFDCLWRTLGCP